MKKKNSKNSQNKSPETNASPWPNLPQRIIKYVAKHPNALEKINFGLATKSWECLSPQCRQNSGQTRPRLLVSDPFSSPEKPQYCGLEIPLYDYLYHWYGKKWRSRSPLYVWTRFLGCSHGDIISSESVGLAPATRIRMFNTRNSNTGDVWPEIPFASAAVLTVCAPRYRTIVMVATGVSSPAFVFCKFSYPDSEWIKKDCEISEPDCRRRRGRKNGEDFMRFTNVIGVDGKFYALSSQGTLAVIEETDPDRFEITAVAKSTAVPSVPARGFRECLVESDGEILVVFLVHGTSSRVVDGVEVYRLGVDDLSWVRMESLGEKRTLFVGVDCCVSVCAERVGCDGDRVYFAQRNGVAGEWWEFDMKAGAMSRPEWAVGGGNGNALEWDKPVQREEDDHEAQ